jgi:hypothetical protein
MICTIITIEVDNYDQQSGCDKAKGEIVKKWRLHRDGVGWLRTSQVQSWRYSGGIQT